MRDERFIRGGVPMTKREVRALAIDALELEGARSLVDIGAGTGSVSIQAAVQFPGLKVTSVERVEEGIELIRANADRFGVEVETIHREAPFDLGVVTDGTCDGGVANAESSVGSSVGSSFGHGGWDLFRYAPFDRVFLGGTGRKVGPILEWLRPMLSPGTVLVMTTITIESFYDLLTYLREHETEWGGVEATQIQASRLEPLGTYTYFKPQNPCQIVRFQYLGGSQ